MSGFHRPVLVPEITGYLRPGPGMTIVDATAGGGGHTEIFVRNNVAQVYAVDTDPEAVDELKKRFTHQSDAVVRVIHGNFRDLKSLIPDPVDAVLMDLGVSSHQLDTPRRGFSLREDDAPLDMRMDRDQGKSAGEVINRATVEELYEIISLYGEEKHSRAISVSLHRAGCLKPVLTAGDLKRAVSDAVPGAGTETYARVFQAFRMYVNDEIDTLKLGLDAAYSILKPGGRLAVVSFHSLEDRVVKLEFKKIRWTRVTGKPVTARHAEVLANRRSRSAKLRVAEKVTNHDQ